jgi:hypothetical protein
MMPIRLSSVIPDSLPGLALTGGVGVDAACSSDGLGLLKLHGAKFPHAALASFTP